MIIDFIKNNILLSITIIVGIILIIISLIYNINIFYLIYMTIILPPYPI
jgi:hypothetical protein